MKGEAHYDNTTDNPENPNSPPQDVSLGEGTSDEMMLIYFIFAPFQPADTSIVIDDENHWAHDSISCNIITENDRKYSKERTSVSPNPGSNLIKVDCNLEIELCRIRNVNGQILTESGGDGFSTIMYTSTLPRGLQILEITTRNGIIIRKKIMLVP